MIKLSRRLGWLSRYDRLNPLTYVFLYFSFVTGLFFFVRSRIGHDGGSTLYMVALQYLGYDGVAIMGIGLMSIAVIVILTIIFRKMLWLTILSAWLGFSIWCWLGIIYAIDGYWPGVLGATVPNVFFWWWVYFKTEKFKKFDLKEIES